MAMKTKTLLSGLSTSDLKKLLVARERIDVLEEQRDRLAKDLAAVDRELAGLLTAAAAGKVPAGAKRGRKPAAGKTGRKKAGRKKTGKKKTAKRKVAKKAARTKSVRSKGGPGAKAVKTGKRGPGRPAKKASRKGAGRTPAGGKRAGKERIKLEDVIVNVLRQQGPQLSFQDLLRAIVEGKLYATKSKKFDNVLRRTLSTSELVKRVGRGVYAAA